MIYVSADNLPDQDPNHEAAIKWHFMCDKLWDVFFTVLGGVITGLIAVWINDRQTRKYDVANRLRNFSEEISGIIVRLQKIADVDAKQFNTDTRDQVLVLCARIADDIPATNTDQFARAGTDYCDIQERDEKSAAKFILHLFRNPPANPREPVQNPFRDDPRPQKERMLDMLKKLKDCAK